MPKKLHLIAGARPNFVKLAPLVHALRESDEFSFEIVHTGQHYDDAMSGSFFRVLDIPSPDINLGVGSASHAVQVARILEATERVFAQNRPDAVVVFGDVNSTMAATFAAATLGIPSAHVEAGLRSFDRSMPEEINRIVADSIAAVLLASEPAGKENLLSEGATPESVHLVGNIMIDSLRRISAQIADKNYCEQFGLKPQSYALLTMHRPSNVDQPEVLARLLELFRQLSERLPIVFPMHPRTRRNAEDAGLNVESKGGFHITEPVDYVSSLGLQRDARVVFTDSGGMQEETTLFDVPCLTLRFNTERPITVEQGTSTLVGNDASQIEREFESVLDGRYKKGSTIDLWDGRTAGRIVDVLWKAL